MALPVVLAIANVTRISQVFLQLVPAVEFGTDASQGKQETKALYAKQLEIILKIS